MIDITVAKNAGFCFGVKRAIDMLEEIVNDPNIKKPIYSIGAIIHNDIVIKKYSEKGVIIVDEKEALSLKDSTVILRTHGVEKKIHEKLLKNNNKIIDLTCPYVKKIHKLVSQYTDMQYKIIIIGDKSHVEVKGIVSYANDNIAVVNSKEDIENLKFDKNEKIVIMFQTTANIEKSKILVDILLNLFYNCKSVMTICAVTSDRQNEVYMLSKNAEAVLVVGSQNSSNTKKLYEISKKNCDKTYMIESKEDFDKIDLGDIKSLVICTGASTPKEIIEEIVLNARAKF